MSVSASRGDFQRQRDMSLGTWAWEPSASPQLCATSPAGQIRYTSACSVNLSFPAGIHWSVVASYGTPLSAHYPSSTGSGFASPDMNVDVT